MACSGAWGRDGTFLIENPPRRLRIMSVKVPPVSTPILVKPVIL